MKKERFYIHLDKTNLSEAQIKSLVSSKNYLTELYLTMDNNLESYCNNELNQIITSIKESTDLQKSQKSNKKKFLKKLTKKYFAVYYKIPKELNGYKHYLRTKMKDMINGALKKLKQ